MKARRSARSDNIKTNYNNTLILLDPRDADPLGDYGEEQAHCRRALLQRVARLHWIASDGADVNIHVGDICTAGASNDDIDDIAVFQH